MNYIETVTDLFLKRSCKKILAASDYVCIAEWEKEQIPLEIVLDSINRIFNDLSVDSEKFDSIQFLEDTIQMGFADSIRQNFNT